MTGFQKLALLLFAAVVLFSYGKDIYAWLKLKLASVQLPAVPGRPAVANDVVGDLVTVAGMRDRLAAEGCREGADACSALLKVLIDHKHPHVG
jgi:hypothetical protein